MQPDRWKQVKEIFQSAVELPPAHRDTFLAEACLGHDSLRREVESLIRSHELPGSFIDSPAYQMIDDSPVAGTRELTPGQTLGPYKIVETIGAGGMGIVYLSEDQRLDRKVALKLLPPEVASDPQRIQRFVREARTVSALNHPNILTIYEFGEAEAARFIAMEYVRGETLRDLMNQGPLELNDVFDIAIQIAAALSAAHEAGVVHRDIKPENVMVRDDQIIKVLDFGLAKATPKNLTGEPPSANSTLGTKLLFKTEPGLVMGTVRYMSPEHWQGTTAIDHRADIWSLGVMIFEMVTAHVPFEAADIHRQIIAIQEQEPPLQSQYREAVPQRLEEIVGKALARHVDERYQTATDLLSDLRNLKRKLEVDAEIERTIAPELRTATVRLSQPESVLQTATGVHPSETAPGSFSFKSLDRYKTLAIPAVAVLLLTGLILSYFYFTRDPGGSIDSIAVLPFVNTGNDPNTEYLSDGITESIINSLSQLPQLKVMARSTVFRFKQKEIDPLAIGKQLGVHAVMTGTISQQGDNLTVSAELVNVADGRQLWGDKYNRKIKDIAAVQQDIARAMSDRLRLRLSGDQQRQLNKGGTTNPEAYQLFLQGRYYLGKSTGDDFRKAIQLFQQATERDPKYALAYIGLAECYTSIGAFAGTPGNETLPPAKTAIEQALRIDDSLAEAHSALAILYFASWQWEKSEAEFQRAISLNPSVGHMGYSNLLRAEMRYDEALREIKLAQELDPLDSRVNALVARAYHNLGDDDSAIRANKEVIALDPDFPLAHLFLGLTYGDGLRRYDLAIPEFQKAVELSGRGSYTVCTLGAAYARSGKRDEAIRLLKELEEKYAKREANGTDIAIVRAALGDDDRAIDWLEKDFEAGNTVFLAYVTNLTSLHERLRNNPRYQNLLRRMGLKV